MLVVFHLGLAPKRCNLLSLFRLGFFKFGVYPKTMKPLIVCTVSVLTFAAWDFHLSAKKQAQHTNTTGDLQGTDHGLHEAYQTIKAHIEESIVNIYVFCVPPRSYSKQTASIHIFLCTTQAI